MPELLGMRVLTCCLTESQVCAAGMLRQAYRGVFTAPCVSRTAFQHGCISGIKSINQQLSIDR